MTLLRSTNIRGYRIKIDNTSKALREKLHKALLSYGEPVDPKTSLISDTTMLYENFRFHTDENVWYCTCTNGDTTKAVSIEDFLMLLTASQEQPMQDFSIAKYLKREPQIGDYVERIKHYDTGMSKGSIWKVTGIPTINSILIDDDRGCWDLDKFKVINPEHPSHPNYQTPQLEIKPQPGTHWERLNHHTVGCPKGQIIVISTITDTLVKWVHPISGVGNRTFKDFFENFKPRPDLDTQTSDPTPERGLAFYKESGKPWTEEELDNVRTNLGDISFRYPMGVSTENRKYIYYKDTKSDLKVYPWDDQSYPETLEQVSYESVFIVATKAKTKSKPVAQPKPIQSTTKETFMSKIKEIASTTVGQNKQALVIASKMEAGRIINKQVLKQLKPHLPFFLQGYASSPFAPFLAANLVAMTANYIDDSRVKKISELMLLGAADSGVSSLNISKIIDDVLSNIKLPAGILDDSDEE